MAGLFAKDIKKQYFRKGQNTNIFTAVDTLDIELAAGEVTIIKGRSGSGKTTLMHMLSGILSPSEGAVFFDGQDIYRMSEKELSRLRNEKFSVIPQGQGAIGSLNVLENVLLPFSLYNKEKGKEDEAVKLLEKLGIDHLKNVLPRELSGGEMRRMSIARALLKKSDVIFADEPTGDLDDENTKLVFDLLKQAAQEGAAVLIITHESGASQEADHIYRMDAGILQKGDV